MDLPASATAAGQARRYVAHALSAVPPDTAWTAALLTSELVANAVEHGASPLTLQMSCLAGVLRIEVADGGKPIRHDATAPTSWTSTAESARGLLLVDALAASYGCHPHPTEGGKTSWFELELA